MSFDPSSKGYNPNLFISLLLALCKKLCTLGQTRVLFRDGFSLEDSMLQIQQISYEQANL